MVSISLPRHSVASQLNIFTPVGMAMSAVMKLKKGRKTAPVVNIWCAHTLKLSRPMAIVANTKARYPNSGLRLNVGRISLTTPMAGRMTM